MRNLGTCEKKEMIRLPFQKVVPRPDPELLKRTGNKLGEGRFNCANSRTDHPPEVGFYLGGQKGGVLRWGGQCIKIN